MNTSASQADKFQLGPFEVREKENVLATPEQEIVLLPKVMMLLIYLCRHSQRVVTFDELNDAIWPREVVGDNAIYNLVGQLRKVLGDKASDPIYIQTVSKQGYRLLIAATPLAKSTTAIDGQSAELPEITTPSAPQITHKTVKQRRGITLLVAFTLVLASYFLLSRFSNNIPETAEEQMRLARYQLYRGDAKGIEQGIESLQQALTAAPGWEIALIELAHAYLRKLTLEPENAAFWLAKAETIASENELGKRGQRLAALLDAIKENKNIAQLAEWFTDTDILNSARLSYSRMLFGQGKTQEALTQALLVKDNCVNCPYVYQQLAATYMVLGQVQESFDSFARYRLYQNEDKKHPAEIAGYITLNQHSLREMAKWHFQNPQNKPLLPHQRNALALFYLTLGKVTDAEKLLADVSHSTTQFFDLYTLAALHGAKSDFQSSLKYLQRRQHAYPDNDRFKLSVVVALWQLNQYKDALAALKAFNILDDTKGVPDSIDFSLWSVYAALLQEHGNADFAMDILVKLAATLRAGLLPNSHNSDIRLAAVLALQGKNDEALQQLDITLKQGWVSDFNQNWWYLQDSPYFKKLSANPRFQQLVSRYHMEIESIFQQTRKTY